MKKILIGLASAIIAIIIIIVSVQNTTSGFGPLSDFMSKNNSVETYYAKTTTTYTKLWNGKYRYTLAGYDENGNQQRIVKVFKKVLRSDALIKIDAVGTYGKGWVEAALDKVPPKALEELNK